MPKVINALVTACCGWPTCGTMDALHASHDIDFHVIGVDCSPNPAALNYVDELLQVPRCTEPDYIASLLDICKAKDVQLLIPLISDEIDVIWDNLECFEQAGVHVLMSGKNSLIKTANNKLQLSMFLHEHGIDIMPRTIPITAENAIDAMHDLGYPDKPVCLKAVDKCGSAGFRIIDDAKACEAVFALSRKFRTNPYVTAEHFKANLKNMPYGFVLQEYLPGMEQGTICLVDNGETVYSPSHRNIKMDMSTAVISELVNDERANEIVRKVNKLLRLDGNIGYDFKEDADGNLRLLEINPRISATVSLAQVAGLNLIELGARHALGLDYDKGIAPDYGIKLMRNYGTLYVKDGKPYGRG